MNRYRMHQKKKHLPLLLLLVVTLLSCKSSGEVPQPSPGEPEEEDGLTYVYREGTNGYEVYRIPALLRTASNTLLAFAEARKKRSNGDTGDIDLVVRRSTDGGTTWSDMIMVWDDGMHTCGNPVPILDETSGRIHLLMNWNHGDDKWSDLTTGQSIDRRRTYYTFSDDDGLTWETPRELTDAVSKPYWGWYGAGPVHGIQLQNEHYKGRLVAPCYYTVMVEGSRRYHVQAVYSDDNGITWIPGDTTNFDGVGECTVAELSDGSLMMNMRTGGGARRYAISNDGGQSWGDVTVDNNLPDPECQGSLLSVAVGDERQLFFANAAHGSERIHMMVRRSADDGATWNFEKTIHEGPAAYSDMTVISDTEIGLLFEGGINRPYEGLAFEKLLLEDFQ
ncbi:exo-alpha-sialidase [Olivibacter sp. SDN3]|uniref:sialidase family protein n=1 Tax=Olivibacter sp. SDN3 TaxID=2764720 RepID=UPI0016515B1D|nr:sialidase family protein [Olivibacter sp. SDN3]QNL51687.1 exo-alpha-sialidase [Olivibacter sp. SDN3]